MNITYKHRQEILKTQDGMHTKVAMIVSDRVDWKKNIKMFPSKGEFTSWIIDLAIYYGVDVTEFNDCFNNLVADGYFSAVTERGNRFTVSRTLPGDGQA